MRRDVFAKCFEPQPWEAVKKVGLYPYFRPIEASEGTEVLIDGRRVVMAGSNNYLGLTHDPRVIAAAQEALAAYGTGCTGSRFLNGTLRMHLELESRLAEITGKEAGIVFPTGFQACLGVIASLGARDELILCDRENHASIIDGCRLSFAEVRKYRHADMEALEEHLGAGDGRGMLVVTDGLFSMTGELAPLPEIVALCQKYGARVLVDDAHSFGVYGERGAGTADHFGLDDQVDLIMGTFSKSLAGIGGFCTGPEIVIEYIRHHARSMIFSAATPPAVCATALKCLDIIEAEPERRRRVLDIAARARKGLAELGFNTGSTQSPIVPVILGDREYVFRFWKVLLEEGVFVNPVTAPAVPAGMDLLRCSFMATHTDAHVERFLGGFERARQRLGSVAGVEREAAG
ncbi:MAG: aminotransferase class I/II-fold pyridoxal phosphate-dependent enzyme [Planctomycetota bacterium]|nr:MAG: aminotransferase class I/II-fold pyridoxal phosphate-dependent enzyme [Planctomycetota bacterium]